METKKKLADLIAEMAVKFAKASAGAASTYGLYQPQEPCELKKRLEKA